MTTEWRLRWECRGSNHYEFVLIQIEEIFIFVCHSLYFVFFVDYFYIVLIICLFLYIHCYCIMTYFRHLAFFISYLYDGYAGRSRSNQIVYGVP